LVKSRQSPGTLWQRPGIAQAHFGKDQATARHTLVKPRQSSGTLWQRPGKVQAHFGKDQAESRHTLEKSKQSLAHSRIEGILAQGQQSNTVAQEMDKTNLTHMHLGRGVPSCGMAERPRGSPQRRRKPQPSKNNTPQLEPTGKRRRNTNRGLRSVKRTEERKLKRRTVAAWSRTLYKYHRGNTLAGQARPGRTNKLAHENTRTQFKEFKQAMKAATSNGATSTRAVGQRAHTKGTEKTKESNGGAEHRTKPQQQPGEHSRWQA
jgi:hypothetical protein